jgi:Fe-S-cluster-containing dehydrogenase component
MNKKQEEFQVIIVNPDRCVNCETCMEICSFVHETDFIPLMKRIMGTRKRIELEWAIACDLCRGMKSHFVDPEIGKKPQCVDTCPHNAIFVAIIDSFEDESKIEAIKRVFNQKLEN